MIIETKEELVQQIAEDWDILQHVDADLEVAAAIITDLHKDFRRYMKGRGDTTRVRGAALGASAGMGAGTQEEDTGVRGVPTGAGKSAIRPR